jgi:ribosomal protein S18 acetylase RimI-like enzyme
MPGRIRRAIDGDEPTLRALRLEALLESPDAFGSTYEREHARTPADWRRWLSPDATFILDAGGQPRGLVAGVRDRDQPGIVWLMAMWVHPSARQTGAADALITAVVDWAAEKGAREVRLHVIKDNDRAARCYARNAFRVTGRRAVRERDGAIELEMTRAL